jgi:hypothetical protein
MNALTDFADYRLKAAREFSHTMIVVDDEAWSTPRGLTAPRAELRPPTRKLRAPGTTEEQKELFLIRHALDSDNLVDAAMALGLVCSVVRPPKNRSIRARVGKAAQRADIVCLDWELHNDSGASSTKMILEIARSDEKRNGRLRLTAIYTGDTTNNKVLEKIFNSFPKQLSQAGRVKTRCFLHYK